VSGLSIAAGCAGRHSSGGKAYLVLSYRTFRNTDPPLLVHLWNQVFTGRGAAQLSGTSLLEMHVFAKPYFDPKGLVLALDDGQAVGFAHAGFGPDDTCTRIATTTGVTCMLDVLPNYRERGIGSELLGRSEAYMRERGAQSILAGAMPPLPPFYLGLYGGSGAPGFLASDPAAQPFFTKHGYKIRSTHLVLQRRLDAPVNVNDGRFAAHRKRYDLRAVPRPRSGSWWQECTLGPLELVEFQLFDKITNQVVASAALWDMDSYSQRWQAPAVGILQLHVKPDFRRQGLARFLLSQTFRHLQEQFFALVEAQAPENDELVSKLFKGLGFAPVDRGHVYEKTS
jgi:ribosomal protein S18 acetylase RimI-like enzyme